MFNFERQPSLETVHPLARGAPATGTENWPGAMNSLSPSWKSYATLTVQERIEMT